jgi:geranylgeranyl diphosphate synthase, type II
MAKTLTQSLGPHVDRLGPEIEAALRKYCCLPAECPDQLREAIRYSLMAPGKRLRPMLVLMAAEACGGTLAEAMPAACAVEMIHTYSLIHDDLPAMDDDDLRRGRPTCHKVFGEAMAILAGDALLSLAFQVISEGVRPLNVAAECCAALAEASGPCQLVGGQADDIAAERAGPPHVASNGDRAIQDRDHLESIHARKTGAMIRVSLRLGGMTAGTGAEQLRALDEYGQHLGLAFQVTDDLLDVRSTEESMGKRVGKDAGKGKVTFPGLLGIDESAAYAAQLIESACAAVEPLGPQAEGLIAMARFVLERNR